MEKITILHSLLTIRPLPYFTTPISRKYFNTPG
jgi:hypothetical protein